MPKSTTPLIIALAPAIGLVSILAPGAVPAAEACSCVQTLNVSHPCESYHERSVVFLGRALEEPDVRRDSGGWDRRTYRFAVEEPFHGVTGPTVEVVTGMGGGDCGVESLHRPGRGAGERSAAARAGGGGGRGALPGRGVRGQSRGFMTASISSRPSAARGITTAGPRVELTQ